MTLKNSRNAILGDSRIVAPAVRRILKEMHDNLPDGEYEQMSKEQKAIIDAGIYLNLHRLSQAAAILEELTGENPTNEWAGKIISEIRAIEFTPDTSVAEYERSIDADKERSVRMMEYAISNEQNSSDEAGEKTKFDNEEPSNAAALKATFGFLGGFLLAFVGLNIQEEYSEDAGLFVICTGISAAYIAVWPLIKLFGAKWSKK